MDKKYLNYRKEVLKQFNNLNSKNSNNNLNSFGFRKIKNNNLNSKNSNNNVIIKKYLFDLKLLKTVK